MSVPLSSDDPCYFMLSDGITSTPTVFKEGCYICEDKEFAMMGLPLCYKCKGCNGHVAADSDTCDDCGENQEQFYLDSE